MEIEIIKNSIHEIRGYKVMLDNGLSQNIRSRNTGFKTGRPQTYRSIPRFRKAFACAVASAKAQGASEREDNVG